MNGNEKFSAMRLLIIISVFLFSCSVEPQPLVYGKDACHTCKMTLTDQKFGAEIVTAKGKVYKFDDANCMINFMSSGSIEGEELSYKLMVDYTQPGKLLPVEHTLFLKSDEIRSPMNSGIAAFETETSMEEFKQKWNATLLGWGELQTQFK
jgi:copper chaperone NosL